MTCTGYDAAIVDLVQKVEAHAKKFNASFEWAIEDQFIARVMHIAGKYGVAEEDVITRATEYHEEWKR
jgi:hypothetical protein